MMKIEAYDVTLVRLTLDKIEIVRNWRNDPIIARYMAFREYITPEMQLQWFHRINNERNYYFIIEYKDEGIGLINLRDIDFELKIGESGIFIYDDKWLNSPIAFQATLCLYDFAFENLGLRRIVAHILKDNKRAIKYNMFVGFRLEPDQDFTENQLYALTYENYLTNRAEVSHILK